MLNWILIAISSGLLIGSYNLFLEGTKKTLPNEIFSKLMFINFILISSSVFSFIILLFYYLSNKELFKNNIKNIVFNKTLYVIIPSIIIIGYMFLNVLALSKGGGIAALIFTTIGAFVTLIGGAIIFKDKINIKIILSLIIGFSFIIYASLQSKKINNT